MTLTQHSDLSQREALALYETMFRIRSFETRAGELFAAGRLPGFIHLSIGQEAVAAGVCGVLEDADYVTTTHRGHGHCIAKGGQVLGMMAELFGREGGYGLGRSGSMHIADSSVGILGANAIVGAGIPMALGGAWSAQMDGSGRVAVAFFGDGAVAEGVFHECVNLAALWRLPLLMVCENNGYAELTPVSTHLANPRVAELVTAFGVPSVRVDGNDVLAVREAAQAAVARARAGEGPSLIECDTTRWRGHFEGDPQHYRGREEIRALTERDPVAAWRTALIDERGLTAQDFDDVEARVTREIEDAVDSAEAMEPSRADGLLRHVYAADPEEGDRR